LGWRRKPLPENLMTSSFATEATMEFEGLEIVRLELKYCERCGGLWMRTWGTDDVIVPRAPWKCWIYLSGEKKEEHFY
jgi:hypothetical protein